MEEESFNYIGYRRVWGHENLFGINESDRRHHLYAIGKTGVGKTTLLRNMIIQDIEAGRGVGLVDPHGDLAEELLDYIPSWRTEDVVYFNPSDLDYPTGFNLLQNVPDEAQHLAASGVVSAFKGVWSDSWGPRLEYILHATVAALLECQNTSLLGVQRMLVDKRYRDWVVKQVKDPMVRSFWVDEFARYDERFLREAIAPLQNKVGQLLMAAPLRNILGQVKSHFDPGFMMNNRRILIANLSKGKLGEDKANLLGAMLVAKFQLAAMGRANVPEDERPDFFLYIDEFQNFRTDSFASILSEARKYHLCLTLSHQYLDQLSEEVRKAVLGNVGSIISFRVGNRDADALYREFEREYDVGTFTDLANHQICVKLLEGGQNRQPFLGRTLPPIGERQGRRDTIIRRSRERYSANREVMEGKIQRWLRR